MFIFPPITKEAKRKRPKFRNEFMLLKNDAANEGFYRVHEAKKVLLYCSTFYLKPKVIIVQFGSSLLLISFLKKKRPSNKKYLKIVILFF